MLRVVLCNILSKKVDELRNAPPPEPIDGVPVIPAGQLCIQDLLVQNNVVIDSINVANYVLDFGNVICGQSRKKVFKIMNASILGQLNWTFDPSAISSQGFAIEPDRVQKLTEQSSIDFTVKFFARTNVKLGRKTVNLPLVAKGSPGINIVFRSFLSVKQDSDLYGIFMLYVPLTGPLSVYETNICGKL
jgi:hypothetical protein